ncbi:hypothetical protein BPNPMPFG_005432 [Mesorhizobium sp. AR07]|uniref:hypothetical protein n=1 Tax=Mesorhizobium sp. AR07 TaxID=2865838 RepID=UPI00215F7195|nr:hypothetical protein [Mesorhizobium sp. AR07]UVK43623.1 hypothetical protein BPNPMPFG_005432 [Mesorhizobium sp. AR07]
MADEGLIEEELAKIEQLIGEAVDEDLAKLGEGINDDSAGLQRERDIDREIAKFKANALDRASTSLVTLGAFAPLVGLLYHSTTVSFMQDQELATAVVGCLVGAFVLHWVGRGFLETGFRQ